MFGFGVLVFLEKTFRYGFRLIGYVYDRMYSAITTGNSEVCLSTNFFGAAKFLCPNNNVAVYEFPCYNQALGS